MLHPKGIRWLLNPCVLIPRTTYKNSINEARILRVAGIGIERNPNEATATCKWSRNHAGLPSVCMPQLARFVCTRLVRDFAPSHRLRRNSTARQTERKRGTHLKNPFRNETCQRRLPSVTNTCYDYCNFNNKHGVF